MNAIQLTLPNPAPPTVGRSCGLEKREQEQVAWLDLNEFLVPKPTATFFMKVVGDSMAGAGIFHDDLLVVDRSLEAKTGNIIVATLDGNWMVKRLLDDGERIFLQSESEGVPLLEVGEGREFRLFGVVRWVLHQP